MTPMRGIGIAVFCFSFILFCSFTYGQPECDLKKDKDGIKVFTCKSDSSKFRSLVAEFDLENTSLETLEDFMWDVDNYVNWQYDMVQSDLIRKLNDHEMIYRTEIDAPWPVDDREQIVKFHIDKSHATDQLIFYINSSTYDYPPKEGVIRVPYSRASWHVIKNGSSLRVKYSMKIDPGGYVPPMLVNLAMAEGPYVSFLNLKRMIEKR